MVAQHYMVRMPWLVALGLEALGLQLCALGLRRLEQARSGGSSGSRLRGVASASDARDNGRELHHRCALLALFLVRPAARVAIRKLLTYGLRHRLLGRWCATALELVDALETSLWARYFRTSERLQAR